MSSPLVVESVVLHSLVGKIPKLGVRRGHVCLITLNNGVLVLHFTTHSLHTYLINQTRAYEWMQQTWMRSQVQKHSHDLRKGWCAQTKNQTGRKRKARTARQAQMHGMIHLLSHHALAELTSPILCRSFNASLMTSKCLSCSFVSRRTSSRSCSTQQTQGSSSQHANVSCSHAHVHTQVLTRQESRLHNKGSHEFRACSVVDGIPASWSPI